MTTARYATALTGGTAGALDAKAVATLADGDIAWVATGTVLYVYKFIAAATDAESSPGRIRPDDYATAGVWYLQNVSADYSQMVRNDIDGGDITTSGQDITVTPCGCWDSERETWLETVANATWTVAGTNNLEQYLFLVRLVAGGTFTVKAYTTYAGPSSDVLVDKWRFISWAKNNGSGVLMPYRQVGDRIDWTTGEMVVVTATTTTSFVSYSLSSVIPVSLISIVGIASVVAASTAAQYSYDGTTVIASTTNTVASTLDSVDILPVNDIFAKHVTASIGVRISSITIRR